MNKTKNISTVWKKLWFLLALIISLFIIINIVWLVTIYFPYKTWSSDMEKIEIEEIDITYYEKISNGYTYSLYQPGYLDFTGHFSVSDIESQVVEINDAGEIEDTIGGLDITLYIWPNIAKNYNYGIFFLDTANDIFEQVYIDSGLNVLKSESIEKTELDTIQQLINDNKNEIMVLFENASAFWNIKIK